MYYQILRSISIFIFIVWVISPNGSIEAQSSFVATGATISDTNSSYSIGQLNYKSTLSSFISNSPGVQQPFEINDLVGSYNIESTVKISIYPNPTKAYLHFQMDLISDYPIILELYDINLKLVKRLENENCKVDGNQTCMIDITDLVTGVYFMISNINGVSSQHKIVKI
ncbi:MAG: hypothetical protein KBF69_06640 [Saprospiraceae bacterium]|nr:hypothetical protein [Saprospiraceae bacterium]MBK8825940.1 hypothetical protein [Saprospiraceae bacterium]MBK9582225.1 hypothetical protein [Saprospiraceae bacterium]MBP9056044.1 hypothetical protein [Saprospiraceae bacterium]